MKKLPMFVVLSVIVLIIAFGTAYVFDPQTDTPEVVAKIDTTSDVSAGLGQSNGPLAKLKQLGQSVKDTVSDVGEKLKSLGPESEKEKQLKAQAKKMAYEMLSEYLEKRGLVFANDNQKINLKLTFWYQPDNVLFASFDQWEDLLTINKKKGIHPTWIRIWILADVRSRVSSDGKVSFFLKKKNWISQKDILHDDYRSHISIIDLSHIDTKSMWTTSQVDAVNSYKKIYAEILARK